MITYNQLEAFLEKEDIIPRGEESSDDNDQLPLEDYQVVLETAKNLHGSAFKSFLQSIFTEDLDVAYLNRKYWSDIKTAYYEYYYEPKKVFLLE